LVKDLLASNEANVTGMVSVLVAAKDCGVPTVVVALSSSVYGGIPGSGIMAGPAQR
jgi:UDP-glucose 4-epimerase